MFHVRVPHDRIGIALVNQRKHAIVRRDEILIVRAHQQRSPRSADSRIDHHNVNRAIRKIRIRSSDRQRAIEQIKRRHVMRDVDDRDIRINFEDHALQRADQMVVRSVVRSQRNNLVCQWSLSAWAFLQSGAHHAPKIAYPHAKGPLRGGQECREPLLRNRQCVQECKLLGEKDFSVDVGAGDGNRTHVRSLGSFYTAIVRRPLYAHCTCELACGKVLGLQECGVVRTYLRSGFAEKSSAVIEWAICREVRRCTQSDRGGFRAAASGGCTRRSTRFRRHSGFRSRAAFPWATSRS